jgi:uncharacterized surface protein with fasciclin (FAS1) repeats
MRRALIVTMSIIGLVVGGFASTASAGGPVECETIVEIAAGNDDFSTLVTAVTAAGLVDTLSGDGPFTVFAPTNAAFDALPEGTLESLLDDPTGALTDILKLHVIAGEVDSEAAIAAAGTNVQTLGGPVAVALDGENLTVGGATVIATDIEACNGIIHVIDAVITAPAVEDTTTTTTTAPAAPGTDPAPQPTRVDTGDSGLAAGNSIAVVLLAAMAGLALMGIGRSTYALARSRNER